MSGKPKRVRMTIDLGSRLDTIVQNLSQEHGVSQTDIIRDAVRLLVETTQLKKDGFKTGGWRQIEGYPKEYVQILNSY